MFSLLFVARLARRNTSARLLDSIRRHPGWPVGHITQDAGLPSGTVHYHLRNLEAAGAIKTIVSGRRRLVFTAEDAAELERDPHAMALLQGTKARAVAVTLAEHGPMSIAELVERLGGSPRVVYYHVKRLRDVGLVSSQMPTRYRGVAATLKLRLLLSLFNDAAASSELSGAKR